LREERRLRVFDNRMLRRIFGPKRHEITGERRKLHKEALNDLTNTSIIQVNKSRRTIWTEHVAWMRERKGVYRVVVRKPEGRTPLEKPGHRWEDIIKLDL
jgi:hypothetical protein